MGILSTEAEQIEEVEIKLKNIRRNRKGLKVEEITFIDPSMEADIYCICL